jgi:ribosome-associated toxin RatA of RatAB toxin-antitoxin module
MLGVLLAGYAFAESPGSLDALLERGEVTLLETRPDGRLAQVTAMAVIHAPPDVVWAKLVDFPAYEHWMPQVADSTVVSRTDTVVTVDFSVSVVGPNVNFRQACTLDPASHAIHSVWVSGALQGSRWDWKLEPHGADTLAIRTLYTNVIDTNWIVRSVEDENHTLEYGINVATGVVELRGLKKVVEGP